MSDAVLDFLSGGKQKSLEAQMQIPPAVQAQRDAEAARLRAQEPPGMIPGGEVRDPASAMRSKPDPVMAFLQSGGSPKKQTAADAIPVNQPVAVEVKPAPAQTGSWLERAGGVTPANNGPLDKYIRAPAEVAISAATGAIAPVIANVAAAAKDIYLRARGTKRGPNEAANDAADIAQALTYVPKTDAGRAILESAGKIADEYKLAGLVQPGMPSMASSAVPARIPRLADVVPGAGAIGKPSLKGIADAAIPGRAALGAAGDSEKFASGGAAAATDYARARAMVANIPVLKSEVERLIKRNQPINMTALQNYVDAESLPHPVKMSVGAATGDPVIFSEEMNNRGRFTKFAHQMNENEKALVENAEEIRQRAAPDVFATNKTEHGDILVSAGKSVDAKLNADISAKYQALKDANGGQFPLDAKAFVDAAEKKLHDELLYEHVPQEYRTQLNRLRDGGTMTFEQFEAMRTNLARTMRTGEGNAPAAAGVIRQALEEMPMPAGAEHLKPLADAARAAARDRFALLERDPALKAIVNNKASADKFITQRIVEADTKSVRQFMETLKDDPEARQAVASGVIKHLQETASTPEGKFLQSKYNKALEKLAPKLDIIFDAETKNQLQRLGRVAKALKAQEAGSYVNNSNTLTAAMAEGAKAITKGAVNAKTGGFGGELLSSIAKIGQEGRVTKKAFSPREGLRAK